MSYKCIKEERIMLTPQKADEFLAINDYPGQRKLRQNKIDVLARRISDGRFRKANIEIGELDGRLYLVNGQHCCCAVKQTSKSIRAYEEHYKCEDEIALASLYGDIDSNEGGRTIADVIKPRLVAHNLKDEWGPHIGSLLASGISLLYRIGVLNGRQIDGKAEQAKLIDEHLPAGYLLNDLLWGDFEAIRHLKRAPVVGAIVVTYEKRKNLAPDFWEMVKDGENLKKDNPAYKLREYLRKSRLQGHLGHAVSRREMYAKCIRAFNAHKNNELTNLVYYPDKPLPKVA